MKYKVFDSRGKFVKEFSTYIEASVYKFAFGNSEWQIK